MTGWVKALHMDGASAHIRCNFQEQHTYTNRVREAGDWQQVKATIEPLSDPEQAQRRRIRLHVFLEDGAGEVIWDDIAVSVGDAPDNVALNPGFEMYSTDGRDTDFWSLVNAPETVPEGHYSLAEDATIGLTGRHENGCTLFPIGGFAILRANAADNDSTAVNFSFGPYGSGHDHPDRLQIVVYGRDRILCRDAGSWGYNNPMHLTWANQTIAHNTITVDETSQYPQGDSNSIWAGERGSREAFGVLRVFHAGDQLKAVRATCDTAYQGVQLDRTLCLVDDYMIDVFRGVSNEEHTYDLALHGPGELSLGAPLEPLPEDQFTDRGYQHIRPAWIARPDGASLRGIFTHGDDRLLMLQYNPQGAEFIIGRAPEKYFPTTACIARQRGQTATYVTLLEPYGDQASVVSLAVKAQADGLLVTIHHLGGHDEFLLPTAPDGDLTLKRFDAAGTITAREAARAAVP